MKGPRVQGSSMASKVTATIFTGVLSLLLVGIDGTRGATYHSLYGDAVKAYNQQRWFECYTWLAKALHDHRNYQYEAAQCWFHCQTGAGGAAALIEIDTTNFLQPQYLDVATAKSECFRKCRDEKFPGREEAPVHEVAATDQDFENRTPYDYLQICAFKSEKFEDAMSAAYTYLVVHPGHEYMEGNVKYYQTLPQAQRSYFRDLEQQYFKGLFTKGVNSYGEQDWLGAIRYMEESLQQYYAEDQQCTALCNSPLEPQKLQLFIQQVNSAGTEADRKRIMLGHWSQILECRERCRSQLDVVEGGSYLKEMYSYLQFSYFKINDVKRAAECTGTYLHINPSDETALFNKGYYARQHQVIEEDFAPRKDAVRYVKERNKDLEMLVTVRNLLAKLPMGREQQQMTEELDDVAPPIPQEVFGERTEAFLKELEDYKAKVGVTVIAENDSLLGNHRVAIDGIISEEQCRQLVQLASVGAVRGDGYNGDERRTSPHTNYEKFEGLTVSRAAELARDGVLSTELVKLFLDSSESGRAFLEKYLNLKLQLMFQYTHLVCRTALDVNQSERNDLSHPVHSDNCFIQPDGSCLKRPPAYVYRDFTGLIYLNDEFEGGDFFFAHRNLSLQTTLRPKCGRFVGFESDDYHGVLPVTSGRRCALAAWYTLNPAHQELAHAEARTILRSISAPRNSETIPSDFQSLLEKRGSRLAMTEADLNGSQRFAVDGFTTEDQCQQLMKLAKMGVTSDGYEGARNRLSPHTNYEHFIGTTVTYAGKDGAVVGDGYATSKGSPHTSHEVFEGLTVHRATHLAAEQKVTAEAVKLYLTVSQDVLELTRQYLTPMTNLYFSYTHLVCRTALNEKNLDRTDLSHPIHSDNCIIQPDNSCKRERPAYTERDFSAILYLNDNFHGGDFFFTHQNMTVQSSLRPRCGRVVAFNASHYHGVRPVLTGQRCAVALWFTLDQNYQEPGYSTAWNVLRQLEAKAFGPGERVHVEL